MKVVNSIPSAFFLVFLFISQAIIIQAAETSNSADKEIFNLVAQNKIKVTTTSLGGYQGKCVQLVIQNLTSENQHVVLTPGRRLVSDDTTIQDIFIVKRSEIIVASKQTSTMYGYGFCCQSTNHGPYKDATFTLGYMAPPEWIKLAQHIDSNEYPTSIIQSAVWSISNGHSLSSIYSKDREKIQGLLSIVAEIKNEELPWYYFTYERDTSQLFSGRASRIHGQIDYFLRNNVSVTVVVRNSKGQVVKKLMDGHVYNHGKHSFDVDFSVRNWPKGTYEIMLIENFSNLITKTTFKI